MHKRYFYLQFDVRMAGFMFSIPMLRDFKVAKLSEKLREVDSIRCLYWHHPIQSNVKMVIKEIWTSSARIKTERGIDLYEEEMLLDCW